MAGLRIYADYNGLWRPEGEPFNIPLDTFGSLRDLTNAGVRLRDGLALTVSDWNDEHEDLEADATARYDHDAGLWLAVLGPEGFRYVPAGDRTADRRFLCLGCRRDLGTGPTANESGRPTVDSCPHCGTAITAAIAPPDAAREP